MIWCWFNLSNANFIQYDFYSTSNIYDLSSRWLADCKTYQDGWFIRVECLSAAYCGGSNFGEKMVIHSLCQLQRLRSWWQFQFIEHFSCALSTAIWHDLLLVALISRALLLKTQFDCQLAIQHLMKRHFTLKSQLIALVFASTRARVKHSICYW